MKLVHLFKEPILWWILDIVLFNLCFVCFPLYYFLQSTVFKFGFHLSRMLRCIGRVFIHKLSDIFIGCTYKYWLPLDYFSRVSDVLGGCPLISIWSEEFLHFFPGFCSDCLFIQKCIVHSSHICVISLAMEFWFYPTVIWYKDYYELLICEWF